MRGAKKNTYSRCLYNARHSIHNEMNNNSRDISYHWRRRTALAPISSQGWSNRKPQNYLLLGMISFIIYSSSFTTQRCLCYAEDVATRNDDFYDIEDDTYYTSFPTKTPTPQPTLHPTSTPTTPPPTSFPTEHPSAAPTLEPTRAGDDFYEVQIDDYTAETQSAEIYISSISDVILCLCTTFFWVLWLVGTIFPTKIQHLYKSEGIVVVGDVLESYVTHGQGSPIVTTINDGADKYLDEMEESVSEMNGVADTFDALNDLPSYHAIVSYVVPGPIASGRRRTKRRDNRNRQEKSPTNNYYLQQEMEKVNMVQTSKKSTSTGSPQDQALAALNNKLNINHVKVGSGTPPRPPRISPRNTPKKVNISPSSFAAAESPDPLTSRLSKISEEEAKGKDKNKKSLLDSCSFDSKSHIDKKLKLDKTEKVGFYKYNANDSSEYASTFDIDSWDDEYENPEMIGNLFHSLGMSRLIVNKRRDDKRVEKPPPVRVKKRFETNEVLKRGSKNIEIIVLPGNPGSGILKSEFELEEDYMLNGTSSSDGELGDSTDFQNERNSGQMGDMTAGIIGVLLAAASVIGAVHGALTLPYRTRALGWIMVIVSLSVMWPIAMLTYKSVHKLRLFMLNKIISFEPCGDATNLYGLSKLPRANCSDRSKGSHDSGSQYVIMLDENHVDARKGVWSQDENSAVSSLSSHQIV